MPAVKNVGEPLRENRMHGSTGGGGNQHQSASAARSQARLAYPTNVQQSGQSRHEFIVLVAAALDDKRRWRSTLSKSVDASFRHVLDARGPGVS